MESSVEDTIKSPIRGLVNTSLSVPAGEKLEADAIFRYWPNVGKVSHTIRYVCTARCISIGAYSTVGDVVGIANLIVQTWETLARGQT